MAERSAWGLMQIRGMGTAYYLQVDGAWIANGGITPMTAIKLWPERGDAEEACTAYTAETNAVQWHVVPPMMAATTRTPKGVPPLRGVLGDVIGEPRQRGDCRP